MSRRWKITVWVAVPLIVLVGTLAITHFRAKAAAARFRAQLRAQGEKLTIAELIPIPSSNGLENAQVFTKAAARLGSLNYKLQPGGMKMLKPGKARVAWRQSILPTEESTNIWPDLKAEIEFRKAELEDLRASLGGGDLWFQANYLPAFEGFSTQHLMRLKSSLQWLLAATLLHLREQEPAQAWEDLQALVAIPAHYRGEPYMISQVVRSALVAIAAGATWEALQYPGWREDQLAELQSAWESIELISNLTPTLAMERACVLEAFPAARQSLEQLDKLTGGDSAVTLDDLAETSGRLLEDPKQGLDELMDKLMDLVPRRWSWKWWHSYEDETLFLKFLQTNLDRARQAESGRPAAPLLKELTAEIERIGAPPRMFLVSRASSAGVFDRFLKIMATAETQQRIVITEIALTRFEKRHGKLPSSLAALVGEFLPAIPIDPMDGQPLRYRATDDGRFVLYSVGLDGRDDGGDASPTDRASSGFYWTQVKDWVWPQPASDEDIREFNVKLEETRRKKSR